MNTLVKLPVFTLGTLLLIIGCGESPQSQQKLAKQQPMTSEQSTDFETDAQAFIASYAKGLMQELKVAMKEGGALKAIEACHLRAPQIADETKAEHQVNIKRVSEKNRNPDALPSPLEAEILKEFEQKRQAGLPISQLKTTRIEKNRLVYMQAIGTGPLCLNCHGVDLAEPVAIKINELYPKDRATGYQLDQIRGAFVVSRPRSDIE